MFRTANAPTRSHSSFTVSLGLVQIPLSVMTSMEDTTVKRSEFTTVDGELHPVGRTAYDKVTGEVMTDVPVRYAQDPTSGTWVILTDDEIAECTMPKGVAEVVTFVPLAKLHQAYLTTGVAQVRAKTSGMKGAQADHAKRAFGLFLAGLRERKVAALVKVALRGPAKFAAITPDGDLLWLQPADGIRQPAPMDPVKFSKEETALMGSLIDTLGIGTPELTDDTAAKVLAFVTAKAAAGGVAPVTDTPAPAQHDDLFAALSASIDAAKASKGKVA